MHARFCFSILSLLIAATAISAADVATNWNQWRGPSRDSVLPNAKWPADLDSSLNLVWEKPHSPTYSGPIVQDGLVFTTETIDRKNERVTAYNLESGEVVWQREWPGSMAVPFFAAANGDWIRSTPAVTKDALVVLGMRDVMVCLDPKTGNETWRVDFHQAMGTPLPSFGAVCSPIIDDGAVYVQTGGAVVKLSVKDGSVIWKTLENASGMMSSGAFSSPVIATLSGERQLVVQTRQELCGVSLENGKVLWREKIEAFRGMNILTPLVIGDRIFTSAHSGRAQMFDIKKSGDGWTITELWVQKMQAYMSSPVVVDGTIYMHQKNQRFCSINAEDGSTNWTSSPFGKYWSMVTNGSQILALENTGKLMLIKASKSGLEISDEKSVGTDSWAHLAIQGDLVIVRDLKALKVYRWKSAN